MAPDDDKMEQLFYEWKKTRPQVAINVVCNELNDTEFMTGFLQHFEPATIEAISQYNLTYKDK
jgi:hypothetical protein